MKKTLWTAAFVAVGAGSVGVSALSNVVMKGSDTLKAFSLAVISSAVCPAAVGIAYQGGGSGGGETATVASSTASTPTQTVAPMSKFLSNLTCSAANPSKAEGIAFATT